MTRLLIDAGNSCLKWSLSDGGGLVPAERVCYADSPLRQWLKVAKPQWQAVTEVWVSSVGGAEQRALLNAALSQHSLGPVHYAQTQTQCCGVVCGYAQIAQLGVDRWLALLAAQQTGGGDKLIIDLGTAMTIDFLSADGQHQGGAIAPGIHALFSSVSESTALQGLTLGEDVRLKAKWQNSTEGGLQLGVRLMLEGAVARALALSGEHTQVIVTGGHGGVLVDWLKALDMTVEHCPDLVLSGLEHLANSRL